MARDPLSKKCDKIYRSWNVAVRNIFGLDKTAHRYCIEPLKRYLHPKIMLISGSIGFYKTQLSSPKFGIRFLIKLAENDMRTMIGRTLEHVRNQCNVERGSMERICPSMIKRKMKYMPVLDYNNCRIDMIQELVYSRNGYYSEIEVPGFDAEELEVILRWLTTS